MRPVQPGPGEGGEQRLVERPDRQHPGDRVQLELVRGTMHAGPEADQYVLRALRAGASGFLVKSTPPEDLIGLVRVAAEGHTVLSPAAARRLVLAGLDTRPAPASRIPKDETR